MLLVPLLRFMLFYTLYLVLLNFLMQYSTKKDLYSPYHTQ